MPSRHLSLFSSLQTCFSFILEKRLQCGAYRLLALHTLWAPRLSGGLTARLPIASSPSYSSKLRMPNTETWALHVNELLQKLAKALERASGISIWCRLRQFIWLPADKKTIVCHGCFIQGGWKWLIIEDRDYTPIIQIPSGLCLKFVQSSNLYVRSLIYKQSYSFSVCGSESSSHFQHCSSFFFFFNPIIKIWIRVVTNWCISFFPLSCSVFMCVAIEWHRRPESARQQMEHLHQSPAGVFRPRSPRHRHTLRPAG